MTDASGGSVAALGEGLVTESGVDGAAFTLGTIDAAREMVWASDQVAESLAALQFSLGEGPGEAALATHRPVLLADLSGSEAMSRWPVFAAEAAGLPVGAMFTFPLQVGAIVVGVCDTYRTQKGLLSGAGDLARLLRAVDRVAVALVTASPDGADRSGPETSWLDGHANARAVVHQATGMLAVQLGITMAEALVRIRGHAYTDGHDIRHTAGEIVAHRLYLDSD